MTCDDDVIVEHDGGVCTITLNRPATLNAFTLEMEGRYLAALTAAGSDDRVRAVVVTGAGGAFSSGADVHLLGALDGAAAEAHRAAAGPLAVALQLGKPVIAAVEGVAAGIGLAHALMADIRIAARDARFVPAFSRLGLTAEGGVAWLLPRIVGLSHALELLWEAGSVSADRALAIGLVRELTEPGAAVARARELASALVRTSSAYSLAAIKRQVYAAAAQDFDAAMATADALVAESLDRGEPGATARTWATARHA